MSHGAHHERAAVTESISTSLAHTSDRRTRLPSTHLLTTSPFLLLNSIPESAPAPHLPTHSSSPGPPWAMTTTLPPPPPLRFLCQCLGFDGSGSDFLRSRRRRHPRTPLPHTDLRPPSPPSPTPTLASPPSASTPSPTPMPAHLHLILRRPPPHPEGMEQHFTRVLTLTASSSTISRWARHATLELRTITCHTSPPSFYHPTVSGVTAGLYPALHQRHARRAWPADRSRPLRSCTPFH